MIVPARGVYAGWVEAGHGTSRRPAVTNIGTRPTFDGRGVTIETHVLDVDLDLYGRHLSVGFADRLRDEQRFEGPDQLVAQIRADIDAGRALLAGG
jgi:riboflavin kinase/FMN adenylyltransferase